MTTPDVVVKGMGLVCCLGSGVTDVFRRMCAGECGIRPIDRFPAEPYAQKSAGQVPAEVEDRLRERFPDEDFAGALVKAAALEALEQAGVCRQQGGDADADLGLVLATNFGPMETLEWCWRERVDVGSLDEETFAYFRDFTRQTAAFLGCGGPAVQLSLSCASGAGAVALATDWIRRGRARRVLAIGYDSLTEFCWCGLSNLRTITTDRLRPFDSARAGTIFSEGAAAMVLSSVNGTDDAPSLARVAGVATNNNAFHMTAPAKDADGSRRVLSAALADAGRPASEVEHICAHATGTVANDPSEVAAFRNLFGDGLDQMTVSAHKSQLGHMMGGAGLAEAIVTVQILREHVIPPTIGIEQQDPACLVDCVPGFARERQVDCAITNSAGIGGNNSSLVLDSV